MIRFAPSPRVSLALAVLALAFAPAALADEHANGEAENAADGFHAVEAAPFSVSVALDGVVESAETWPVRIELEEYRNNSLELLEGVEQGARVAEGDTLLRFDTEPLERQIADQRISLQISEAGIAQAREDLRLSAESYNLELTSARRGLHRDEQDLERWQEIERPLDRKGAEVSLESARQRLDNAREELEQLQAMYRDEDLTEASEEIVLRRQKHAVAVAEFSLERAEHDYQRTISINIPRRDENMEHSLASSRLSLERTQEVTPRELEQKQLSLEKRLQDHENSARSLRLLEEDLERLASVTAPADGVVFYGSVNRGNWSNGENVAQSMREGGTFSPGAVILTVVDPDALRVRVNVPENQLYHFIDNMDNGLSGYVQLNAFPTKPIPAAVSDLKHVSGSTWDALVNFSGEPAGGVPPLQAGLNVKVHLSSYEAEEALTVPLNAVAYASDGTPYVEVRTDGDAVERREVQLGWRSDDAVEVVDGLAAGDQVKLKQ